MNAVTANDYAGLSTDLQDYEKVTITDRGVVFRSSEDELIWMEVEGACDVLIDDALLPQDEAPAELQRRHRQPAQRPVSLAAEYRAAPRRRSGDRPLRAGRAAVPALTA